MVDPIICCRYNDSMVKDKLKPRESLNFLTWKVSRMLTNNLAARFADAGIEITVEQWRALIPVYKFDGMTQSRLCEIMSQEKTGVSRLVAALEKRSFVRREASKDDRRVKFIYITSSGRELIESTMDLAVASRDGQVKHIDAEDLAVCKRVLWQIIEPSLCGDCIPEE